MKTAVLLASLLAAACRINDVECDARCESDWMDGRAWNDSSVSGADSLHRYLVSRRGPPGDSARTKPVIIAVHGYSASAYEWLELRRHAGDTLGGNPSVLISLVTLGGHGRDVEEFQRSTWKDWGRPILREYDSLVALGYADISLAGSSTGGTLLLNHLAEGRFDAPPRRIFLVDPIITPTAKLLSLARLVGPLLGNSPADDLDSVERRHWYTNRPAETLQELYALMNRVKNLLEDGIRLPPGTQAKMWKAKQDAYADPVSALQIYKGLRGHDGRRIAVEMVDTRKHVFTRLDGRDNREGTAAHDPASVERRDAVFKEMEEAVSAPD